MSVEKVPQPKQKESSLLSGKIKKQKIGDVPATSLNKNGGNVNKKIGKSKRPHPFEPNNEAPPSKKVKTGRFNFKRDVNSKMGFQDKFGKQLGLGEKPNWNKLKDERKELRVKRRKAASGADLYELSIQAKKMMEPLRNRKCSKEKQKEEIPKLYKSLRGKLISVVYSHDMARVVAMILRWGHTLGLSDVVRGVVQELIPEIVKMSQHPYPAHVVRAMIDYCQPQQRSEMVHAFKGHVVKLVGHKLSSRVLDRLHKCLKSDQQYELCKELYGSTHKLVSSKTITGLNVIFECWPNMKEATLNNTRGNLLKIFEKGLVSSNMVHAVLLDYLEHASPNDSTEVLEQVKAHIRALTRSKEGINVIMKCLWASTPKERKKIVKELKDDFITLACKEHTYQLLLTIFDIFDDTVFVQKAIVDNLLKSDNIAVLLNCNYGRKVLAYLCNRRDPKLFTEAGVSKLAPGDTNPYSKKPLDVRASELKKNAVPILLKHFKENSSIWMEENRNLLILLSVLQAGSGDELRFALEAAAKYIANPPNSQVEGIDLSMADNAGCHMVLKKLVEHDKIWKGNGDATFGEALISELRDEHYLAWLRNNRCCFLLLKILNSCAEDVSSKLRSKIEGLSSEVWKENIQIPLGGQAIQKIL